jgi:hypothetical protein
MLRGREDQIAVESSDRPKACVEATRTLRVVFERRQPKVHRLAVFVDHLGLDGLAKLRLRIVSVERILFTVGENKMVDQNGALAFIRAVERVRVQPGACGG